MTNSPKDVLAKARKVRLEIVGSTCIEGLATSLTANAVNIYRYPKAGNPPSISTVLLSAIDAVWDMDKGQRVWRKNETAI